MLRPRTRDAIAAVRATGTHVIVVTGRMFQATQPFLTEARLDDPVVCYQGAVIADPVTGEFLRHVTIPIPAALEAIDAVTGAGFHINCYVDDELYVAPVTPEARAYADYNHVEIHEVGNLDGWLTAGPTKLVAVATRPSASVTSRVCEGDGSCNPKSKFTRCSPLTSVTVIVLTGVEPS